MWVSLIPLFPIEPAFHGKKCQVAERKMGSEVSLLLSLGFNAY